MSTALAVRQPQLTESALQMIMQVAPVMHEARLFGTKTPQQAMAIMIKGYELGFSLTASFENIHVIEDKPSLSPKGALAMILNSPECAGVKITEDAKGCTVWMKRRNGFEYTTTFTLEDAKKAGLVKEKGGWEKYPANMARWRAVGYCADIVFPDVIGGTKRADEYGADLTPDGDVIEGSWSIGSQQAGGVTVSPKPTLTIHDLLATYSPQQIMAANGGGIPTTSEQCQKVLDFLKQATGTDLGLDVDFGGVLGE